VAGSGWSDWGTPERLGRSLDGDPALVALKRGLDEEMRRNRSPLTT
jgi:hypothetical protein